MKKLDKNILPWFFVAALPVLAIGCTGVTFLGHFAVLAVTLGIFVGTLSLNKSKDFGRSEVRDPPSGEK